MKFLIKLSLSATLCGLALSSHGQTPLVLETMSYITVGEYAAGGANTVDTSATTDGGENAVSLETFEAEVAAAFAAGLGGVIDFETDLPGNAFRAVDRRLVTGFLRPIIDAGAQISDERLKLFDNLSKPEAEVPDPYTGVLAGMSGADEAFWYDSGEDPVEAIIVPEAIIEGYSFDPVEGSGDLEVDPADSDPTGFQMVNPTRIIVVEDRRDREFLDGPILDTQDNPVPIYSSLRGIYGLNRENAITIRRGARHISEGALATPDAPGEPDITDLDRGFGGFGYINDEFFIRTSTIEGSSVTAISGSRAMGGGGNGDATAKDLLFDPRDNVVKLGFTLLSFANFQYFQGTGASPDNPNNIIVKAFFSDGTTTDYRGTTNQTNARDDTFFGIKAPLDTAITRLQVRVLGRNFRTFTNIDDVAFITEPSPPYIASGGTPTFTVPSAAVGRRFVRQLDIQRLDPDAGPPDVQIEGLEELGLSFDIETGLITGTVEASVFSTNPDRNIGESFTLDVVMSNSSGERTESIEFLFEEPLPGSVAPEIDGDSQALGVLGRDFRYTIALSVTGVEEENIEYFAVAERIGEFGLKTPVALSDLGLSLSENSLFGKPTANSVVGEYEISLYAMTPEGASERFPLALKIVPPTPEPNFDGFFGNTQTDLLLHDRDAGTLSVALFFSDVVSGDVVVEVPAQIASGLPVDTETFFGDFNGDANTDILAYAPSEGIARVFATSGTLAVEKVLQDWGANASWRILGIGDLNIDGVSDVIIKNTATGEAFAWLIKPLAIGEAPFLPTIRFSSLIFFGERNKNYELLAVADFNGDGGGDLLWFDPELSEYLITPFDNFKFTGSFGNISSLKRDDRTVFTIEEGFSFFNAADVTGDGLDDILWVNEETGAVVVWEMSDSTVPSEFFLGSGESGGYASGTARAGTNGFVVDDATGEPVRQVDLNNDGKSDLIIERPGGDAFQLILLDGALPAGSKIELMEDGFTPRPQQLRGNGTGLRQIQSQTTTNLLENYPQPGDVPLALEDDEALSSYAIYPQAIDERGQLRWDAATDPFHRFPVADTSAGPLPDRDVYFDGLYGPEEALFNYVILQRDGFDGLGRPKAKTSGGFIPLPQLKRIDRPVAANGDGSPSFDTVYRDDREWTPMETGLDGVSPFIDGVDGIADYDARGNRGFLQKIDATGQPVFEGDAPAYELWRDSSGQTVEERSVQNLIDDSIRIVIGDDSGSGAWVAGSELTPLDYTADVPAPGDEAVTLYSNRRGVTNAIIEAIELANPEFEFPASATLPADPGAFDPAADLGGYDVVLTANEELIRVAVRTAVLDAATEAADAAEDAVLDPLYDPALDSLEDQYAAIETAIGNSLRSLSAAADTAAFDSPEPILNEEQLNFAIRRAITNGVKFGVEQAGLIPVGDGVSFSLVPDDIKLFLSGGPADDVLDMKFAMVEALYIASEKLQGLAVSLAVAEAVNDAFGSDLTAADIPIDIVTRTGDVTQRLPDEGKEARIENAIIVGIQLAAEESVSGEDLNYVFVGTQTEAEKADAIAEAIKDGIEAAGGVWPKETFTFPKDVTTTAADLINAYSEANSLEQNADAINEAVAFASNQETGASLSGPDLDDFEYFTNAELAQRVVNITALAVNQFGGEPNEVEIDLGDNPASLSPAALAGALRAGILDSVTSAFILGDASLPASSFDLVFPQGADATAQSAAIRDFVVRLIRGKLFKSDLSENDFALAYSDVDSLLVRESVIENGVIAAIGEELPASSYSDAAAQLPVDLVLVDEEGYFASLSSSQRNLAERESVVEASEALLAAAEGFPFFGEIALQELESLEPDPANAISNNIGLNVSTARFGSINDDTGLVGSSFSPRIEFSVGSLSPDVWRVVEAATIVAVNSAFSQSIPESVLDSFGDDPYAGLDFDDRGAVNLEAIATVLGEALARNVETSEIVDAGFPQEYLLFDLDFNRNPESAFGEVPSPGEGFELIGTGDYDNRNDERNNDLLFFNPATGEYVIYLMEGVGIFAEIRGIGLEFSLFELWQQANFVSPVPGQGFLLYAQGVEDVDSDMPVSVEGYIAEGGPHDGEFVIEFDFRNDDPSLSYGLRATSDLKAAFADIDLVFIDAVPVGGKPVDRVVVKPDEVSATDRFYQVIFDLTPAP